MFLLRMKKSHTKQKKKKLIFEAKLIAGFFLFLENDQLGKVEIMTKHLF